MKNIPRRPPEIKGGAILGVWQDYLRNPPAFLEKAARDCGDIARIRLVHHNAYLLNHPDWIKDVLVTNQAALAAMEIVLACQQTVTEQDTRAL